MIRRPRTVEVNVEVASDNEFMRSEVFNKDGEWFRISVRRRSAIDVEQISLAEPAGE